MHRTSPMRGTLALLAVAALSLPTLAAAQTIGGPIGDGMNANQQTGVNSAISTGQIGSNSRSRATGGNAAGGNASGGTVNNNLSLGGGAEGGGRSTSTLRVAPVVVAPSLQGANPCTAGVSGGSSWIPFGFAFGAQWSERECRDQEWLRILSATGNGEVGRAYVCAQNSKLREAFAAAGQPCPQDQQQAQQTAAAPTPPPPAPVPVYCRVGGPGRTEADRLMRQRNC